MSAFQIVRLAAAGLLLAAVQVTGFDSFLLFGVAYLALPLFLAVAVGTRLPFTNAVLSGWLIGVTWDLLSIELFGRYALVLALCGGVASLMCFGAQEASLRTRRVRRGIATALAMVMLVTVSAVVGETLPVRSFSTLLGLALSSVIGMLVSGSVLNRLALPTRTAWDVRHSQPTDWADRRAGLYAVSYDAVERDAA